MTQQHHDLGGICCDESIDIVDHSLSFWERAMHALLVILSCQNPPLLTTDELRRVVENLEKGAYEMWGYYERWSAAMVSILLDRRVISENDVNQELYGDDAVREDSKVTQRFHEGDIVRVRHEDSRLRWWKPHLRCPGYIFGKTGRIEKYLGLFHDPFLSAFRGPGPKQPLYRVAFKLSDVFVGAGPTDEAAGDEITIDIYQPWIEVDGVNGYDDTSQYPNPNPDKVVKDGVTELQGKRGHTVDEEEEKEVQGETSSSFVTKAAKVPRSDTDERHHQHQSHIDIIDTHETNTIGSSVSTCSTSGRDFDQHATTGTATTEQQSIEQHNVGKHEKEQHTKHKHDRDYQYPTSSGTPGNTTTATPTSHRDDEHYHHQDVTVDTAHHVHTHAHQTRSEVEQTAVDREGDECPGKVVGEALLRILYRKGIVSREQIRETVEILDSKGRDLAGARLVARAWVDPAFKRRLLEDAALAASEMGIATSNPNAPTVLTVVENTHTVHNLVVCTLCSCYPSGLLGLSPSWYKSRSYRARAIREPRKVLLEFGTTLPSSVKVVRVHDSTADARYLVLPTRPLDTESLSEEELRSLVTRDSMIGVKVLPTRSYL